MPTMYDEGYETGRKNSYDILYKKKEIENVTQSDKDALKEKEAYERRSADSYINKRGYFSYNPYEKTAAKQSDTAVREQIAPTLPESLTPTSTQGAYNYENFAVNSPFRAGAESVQNFQPSYVAPQVQPEEANSSIGYVEATQNYYGAYEQPVDYAQGAVYTENDVAVQNAVDSVSDEAYIYESYEDEYSDVAVKSEVFSLTTSMKVVLSMVATIVIVLFTVIFVNSSLVSSLEKETLEKQSQLNNAVQAYEALIDEIEYATSEAAAAEYAQSAGMILK